MHWFKVQAPIRSKLLFAFASLVAIVIATAVAGILLPPASAMIAGVVLTVIAAGLGYVYRETIAGPYVATVVRMEGLASGDLDSPIAFTDNEDCVGRMTKAMFAFRAAAQAQILLNQQATEAAIIHGMAGYFQRLAKGDLTAEIVEDYPEAYRALKLSYNDALANLRDLLGSVSASTDNARVGSQEIAQASEDLARRTEANAASLEQTSASIQEVNGRLQATAEAAARSVASNAQAVEAVSDGRTRAETAVQAMNRVSASAKGIDDVIEGLDKIAFQTRVLAMNAAVEAGRAGDAGRGFAVVADLVSALAMRAEEESKRARDQLSTTQSEIIGAVEAVKRVDSAFAIIATSGEDAARLAGQIAEDNVAQAATIGEISTAIAGMDQSTQQNAAMVEQTSAAARNLTSEIAALSAHAGRFETGVGKGLPGSLATPAPSVVRRPKATGGAPRAAVQAQRPVAVARTGDHGDWSSF